MKYDRARLRVDFPAWQDPLRNLIDGIATGVISVAELKRDFRRDRDTLRHFLHAYGVVLPSPALRAFLQHLTQMAISDVGDPITYEILHDLSKRKKNELWPHSVALGRLIRREKFSWDDDYLDGINRAASYFLTLSDMHDRLKFPKFTTYGQFILLKSLQVKLPWQILKDEAKFHENEDLICALDQFPIDHINRRIIGFLDYDKRAGNTLHRDYETMISLLSSVIEPEKRSNFLARGRWVSPNPPLETWISTLAPNFDLTVKKAANGLWWIYPIE